MAYDLGDTVSLAYDVLDSAGAVTAPATCVLTVTLPDGTTTTPSVTNPSTGRYQADYVPAAAGRYLARWVSTGPATAFSDAFDVRSAAPAYVFSLADAKAHLNITSTTNDEELRGWLDVATEIVEQLAAEVTARRSITERFQADCWPALSVSRYWSTSSLVLTYRPVLSLTSVTSLDGTVTWDVNNLDVDPSSGIVRVLSGRALSGPLRVVYDAGYEVIPARYVGAAKIVLRHLWETQRAAVGGAKRSRAGMVDDNMMLVAGYAVPRAAAELIGPSGPLVA